MTVRIIESASNGVKAQIRLIRAGMGSSGYYSPDVLETYGPAAFPAGTHLFVNHITSSEEWERNGSRDVRDLVGKTLEEATYDPDDESLYATALFYNKDADTIKEIFEDIDLSIEAAGKRDENGEILELIPSPHNAVTLVPRGGREGKIVAFLEAAREYPNMLSEHGKMDTNEPTHETDFSMTPEDIEKIVEAVAGKISEIVAPAPDPEPTPEDDKLPVADVVEALIDANIPKELRAQVYESDDPMKEIEKIKTIRESFASAEPTFNGKVQEAQTSTTFIGRGWSKR